ncbi:hypothetical protein GLOIN_2v1779417 [Rhizophagus irregularis DAOM 181602=DAOM 197198]|uniref:HMG box domain-containing protein n=2 Tax=Rhizophagus irregularis TaxID=588596 RepID=A0A2P4PPU6_RHIID|nr:hypothetical protein GLOIN_2v1779417 [Rhizophagus irregularis DAOM 181602=DAOM 197198]POG67415.1 hypothetical protein GLOIN_2v1779417 [Rhizophagus irregularis DAOM 181602=DAOM 197198]|eukprot:XP_025174281.1 hypothetical protein GLOIN_2v1779417 [Rhizophagus irregularis DAOM 181602=DAOM 197198]
MDEAARKKYCRLLMLDVPPPSNHSKENSSIRTQDNFVFTSFIEPMRLSSNSTVNRENPKTSKCFHFISTKQLLITANISNAKISKLLAKMWRNETEEEKLYWKKIADRKKMEHVQAHPGYVYRLKKPGKRRKTTPSKQPISTLENTCVPELVTSIVNPSTID